MPCCSTQPQPAHEVSGSVEVLARCMSSSPKGACHPLPTRVLPPQCQEQWERSQLGSPVPRLLPGAGAGRRYIPAGILGDLGSSSSGTVVFSFILNQSELSRLLFSGSFSAVGLRVFSACMSPSTPETPEVRMRTVLASSAPFPSETLCWRNVSWTCHVWS